MPVESTLFAAAHWAGVAVDSLCGGRGTCGRCRVRLSEHTPEPSPADRAHLSERYLADGWRLACTTRATTDIACSIPDVPGPPRIAIAGAARDVPFEPALRRISLVLDELPRTGSHYEVEQIRRALARVGLEPHIDESVPPSPESASDAEGGNTEAVLCDNRFLALESPDRSSPLLGIAIDLGTTTVAGCLLDLSRGEVLAQAGGLNRQSIYGADVISRIAYADRSSGGGREMQSAALETLAALTEDLCRIGGVPTDRVFQMVVVGNTTMLHLLLGIDAMSLAVAPFVPSFRDAKDVAAAELGLELHPQARLETLPVLGAYVGADTVAGLLATDLVRGHGVRLFIDVGTNTEIALAVPGRVLATSAPAGPAFEGSGIRCGMTAKDGAIERVRLGPELDSDLDLVVIGDCEATGVCGSGLIDTLAVLLRTGLMDPSGRLVGGAFDTPQPLAERVVDVDGMRAFRLAEAVYLTQRDIRELQSAKSALATGIAVLLEAAGINADEIDEVLLAGSFGSSIDPANAIAVGLVPAISEEKVRFVGNVAAEGAKMVLLSFRERQMARELPHRVDYVELSAREDFNDRFLAGLGFPQLSA